MYKDIPENIKNDFINSNIKFISLIDFDNLDKLNQEIGVANVNFLIELILEKFTEKFESFNNLGFKIKVIKYKKDILILNYRDENFELFFSKTVSISKEIFSKVCFLENKSFFITSTIGFCKNEYGINSIKNCLLAIKEAKLKREPFMIYSDYLRIKEQHRYDWSTRISMALKNQKIYPVFQGIYNIKKEKIDKYECLTRLEEDGVLHSPIKFFDTAIYTKLYSDISKTIIKKSFDIFKNKEEEFSINLNYNDIVESSTRDFLLKTIRANKNTSKRLILEIIETEHLEDIKFINDFLIKLKKYGVKIAIDDFGTKYNNLDYLISMKIDFIKIDGVFIKNLLNGDINKTIVKTIIDLSHKLNVKVIAEFVEDEETFNILKEMNCDYIQGFYFSKPEKIE